MGNTPTYRPLAAAILALNLGLSIPAVALAESVELAESPAVAIHLPAQPLAQAVLELAQQTGLIIGGDAALLHGKQAPALTGKFTPDQALQRLLRNSGVTYQFTGENQVKLIAAPHEQDSVSALPPVNVSASSMAGAQNTVGYGRDEVEALQPQDMKDLFRKESSVSVGGSIPVNQKVYVRGVEETALSVRVDGARQNNKVFHHNATNLIDPSLLKAVRVSAGVAAADDGPGALGGSLVYETVDVADLLAPDRALGGFVNGRYASNGDQVTSSASLYGRGNGLEFLGYLNHTEGNDYDDGEGNTVGFSAPGLISGMGKVAYENEQVGRFELSHEQVNDDAARPYRANLGGLTEGRPVPESRIYDLTRQNTIFNYSRETGAGLWNPSLTIANNETTLDTREVPLNNPSSTIVYTGITESISATAKNSLHADFATIAIGVDYYEDTATFQFAGDPDLEEQAENLGTFVQLRQPLGEAVKLSYGLRYDRQDFTGTDGSTHSDSGASGNLFGEFRLNDHFTLTAGYAEVWGGVALAENFILNGAWDYSNLQAVEAANHTLGIRGQFNGFVAEANTFRTQIENGRVPSWGGGADLVADFDVDGYDMSIGYVASRGEITLKYANIKTERDGEPATSYDGNYFTAPLGEQITLNGLLDFPAMRVTLGLNARMALDNDAVESSGAIQEGYNLVDVYADYAPLEQLTLRFAVDNLTDEDYTDRASYGQEFTTVRPLLEPGRSFIASARYTF